MSQTVTRQGAARASAPAGGAGHPGVALLVIATAQLMVVLDSTVVYVACHTFSAAWGFPAAARSG
jgi:hypothetical protein